MGSDDGASAEGSPGSPRAFTSAALVGVASVGVASWATGRLGSAGLPVGVVGLALGLLGFSKAVTRALVHWRSADGAPLLHVALTAQSLPEGLLVWLTTFVHAVCGGEAIRMEANGGVTPLHVAASENLPVVCRKLLSLGAFVSKPDGRGLTPLLYAVNASDTRCPDLGAAVAVLLEHGAEPTEADGKRRSAVYHAGRLGRVSTVKLLLEAARVPSVVANQVDNQGYTALHAAVLGPRSQADAALCVETLILAGANPNLPTDEGATPLHLCSRRTSGGGWAIASMLLDYDASWIDPCCFAAPGQPPVEGIAVNTFGSTALHVAAGACGVVGDLEIVRTLIRRCTGPEQLARLLEAQDNDGQTALHFACSEPVPPPGTDKLHENSDPSAHIAAALIEAGAAVNAKDYSDATPLVVVAYRPPSAIQIECVEALLQAGADVTLENEFGWGPMHVASSTGNRALFAALEKHAPELYLKRFDPTKPRDMTSKKYIQRCGGHNRIPLQLRRNVLEGDHTVAGVAKWIHRRLSSNDKPHVVVLVGAGVSTNAGIPDFRSPVTGMYNDDRFRNAFDQQGFYNDPTVLWSLARDVFSGVQARTIKPTPSHYLIRLLHKHGLLTRVYTQNIDGLEVEAGVPEELVVEAHGTMRSAYCERCGHQADMDAVWAFLRRQNTVTDAPTCERCGPTTPENYRPAITMFGERLPQRFEELRHSDLSNADLILVMGTSLVVYPFAGLVNQVAPLVPRLLINNKLTGPFQLLENGDSRQLGDLATYRDAAWTGDCDEGAEHMCKALGWETELQACLAE